MESTEKRMLVTRAHPVGKSLMDDSLRRLGFIPDYLECVRYALVSGVQEVLERESKRISQGYYDWFVLSSPRTVGFLAEAGFFRRLDGKGPILRCGVAAVGDATWLALREYAGTTAEIVPSAAERPASARDLLEIFPDKSKSPREKGKVPGRVFLPQSVKAREVLTEGLRGKGWEVHRLGVYEPCLAEVSRAAEYKKLMTGCYGALLITSGSAVEALGPVFPVGVQIYTLGSQTHAELIRLGIANDILTGVL